jgi:hypothetical protein
MTAAAFAIFALVTIGYAGIFAAQQRHILRTWPRAEATIVESRVVEHTSDSGPLYGTELRLAFSAAGRPAMGNFIFPHESTSRERKEKQAEQYAVGSRQTIVYDPENPSRVLVRPGYNVEFFVVPVFVAGVGGIFAIIAAIFWVTGSLMARRAARATA